MSTFQPIACSFVTPKSEPRNNTGIRERQFCVLDVSDIPFVYNPRFAELLRSNDPPKTADLLFLHTSLDNALSISAQLSEAILAVQCVQEALESANTAVLTAIAQHKEILNPVRSIPDDIILTIFEWCCSSDQGADSLSSSRAPWTLSHVSRRWRTLAISAPCLWTDVDIAFRHIDTSIPNERERLAFKLDLYLSRSAQCDLFVHFGGRDVVCFDQCLPLLLPTANRWKSLTFQVHNSTFPLGLAECRFERLTELNVFFWFHVPDGYRSIWHVPNLRDLQFSGSPSGTVDIDWEGIRRYGCDEHGLRHLPELIALEHLSLNVRVLDRALGILTSLGVSLPLTLPTLRSIYMCQKDNIQAIDKLSDFFLLPSLTTLSIDMANHGWRFPTFNGSLHLLQNLSLISDNYISLEGEYPFDEQVLRSFLAECTSVTALYLKMGDSSEGAILRALAYDGALPKLTSLRVAVQSIWNHPGAVLDLVELRCEGVNVAPLGELRIVEVENTQKAGETMTDDILERWRVVRGKVEVLTVSDNDF